LVSVVFFITNALPLSVAFDTDEFCTRTTLKELEYAKKLAAVKNPSNVVELGFPNLLTNSCSLDILTTSSNGPCVAWNATAPIEVETAGIILVRSFSCTRTPGDT